ncbi:hypothetical protein JKP88DRAFT_253967 [Tribonema minus]|uniref:Uncharacterized protein n=1 Tax=Tribonema minus TaxID=303371 RepID=A0A835Z803_9STRA|nr:hypothetical protein JKP88DRAFT_253967 [Tribonema minus]
MAERRAGEALTGSLEQLRWRGGGFPGISNTEKLLLLNSLSAKVVKAERLKHREQICVQKQTTMAKGRAMQAAQVKAHKGSVLRPRTAPACRSGSSSTSQPRQHDERCHISGTSGLSLSPISTDRQHASAGASGDSMWFERQRAAPQSVASSRRSQMYEEANMPAKAREVQMLQQAMLGQIPQFDAGGGGGWLSGPSQMRHNTNFNMYFKYIQCARQRGTDR